MEKIGFGGGCHWCTEAVFQTLKGVYNVEQGWIAATEAEVLSEAVIVHFDEARIDLQTLIEIHLHTHSSTANHSRRLIYRSAIYAFNEQQTKLAGQTLRLAEAIFDKPLVTKVYTFKNFEASPAHLQNYYYRDASKPFCKMHIDPKLKLLLTKYSRHVDSSKLPPVVSATLAQQ